MHVGTVLTRVHQLIAPRHAFDGLLAVDVGQSCDDLVQLRVGDGIVLNEEAPQTFFVLKVQRCEFVMFGCYQMEVLVGRLIQADNLIAVATEVIHARVLRDVEGRQLVIANIEIKQVRVVAYIDVGKPVVLSIKRIDHLVGCDVLLGEIVVRYAQQGQLRLRLSTERRQACNLLHKPIEFSLQTHRV